MKFPYSTVVISDSGTDDLLLFGRPEIPVVISGVNSSVSVIGLVDTGSDYSIFPKSIADDLGIPLTKSKRVPANVFGGQEVKLFVGEAELRLADESEAIAWKSIVSFYDFGNPEDETILLGHAGFLDYFTATFDGYEATLTLLPNSELPSA